MVNRNVRSGRKVRKRVKEVMKTKHAKYVCKKCKKKSVSNVSYAVWQCNACKTIYAGGAYKYQTAPGKEIERKASQATQ